MIRNKLSEYKTDAEKTAAFRRDCAAGAVAWDSNGCKHLLRDLKIDSVEFVAGLWRVQNKFNKSLQFVRDREFVLLDRINRTEKNLFEFYHAAMVGHNCYGYFASSVANVVVAKYVTNHETYWSYGKTLEEARAFLGIKLYDVYQDLIHSVACGKEQQK